VLVHGAFADASSWNGVIALLQQQGYTVVAPPSPLRGVAADSTYTASLLGQIDGPVLLAGHSYGGAVITNAATSAPHVVGLIYVAAFAQHQEEHDRGGNDGTGYQHIIRACQAGRCGPAECRLCRSRPC
jgi:pimeloyl-ACP methyl ester carboxylesterase